MKLDILLKAPAGIASTAVHMAMKAVQSAPQQDPFSDYVPLSESLAYLRRIASAETRLKRKAAVKKNIRMQRYSKQSKSLSSRRHFRKHAEFIETSSQLAKLILQELAQITSPSPEMIDKKESMELLARFLRELSEAKGHKLDEATKKRLLDEIGKTSLW